MCVPTQRSDAKGDIFCTLAEGVKGQRALDWRLVDAIAPRSRFEDLVKERLARLAASVPDRKGPGVPLPPLQAKVSDTQIEYTALRVLIDRGARTATLTLRGPDAPPPADAAAARRAGADLWMLRLFRELDDALCRLRFNEEEAGLLLIKTEGDAYKVAFSDPTAAANCAVLAQAALQRYPWPEDVGTLRVGIAGSRLRGELRRPALPRLSVQGKGNRPFAFLDANRFSTPKSWTLTAVINVKQSILQK